MLNDSLAVAFRASQWAISTNLNGISHEESLRTPEPGGNSLNWIAGHILAARNLVLKQLGEQPVLGSEELAPYNRGSKGLQPADPCLDLDRLQELLRQSGERIAAGLESVAPEALEAELPADALPVPIDKPTVGALLTFLVFHEGYHAGQLGLGRRLLGKEGAIT